MTSQTCALPTPTTAPRNDLLPLFVGITGHRDLRDEDVAPLRETVRHEFQVLKARYPHTPLIALSPLGEGADRVVACVALEEGLSLIVPLPMPIELYEESFSDDKSRADFRELLNQARDVFTIPWLEHGHEDKGATTPIHEPTPAQIEGQYAAMGAYLARYSHVLLALWDGDASPEHERIGGTAHIVRFRLHGAPPPYGPALSLLERAGYGSVHHVLTPRKSRPLPPNSREPYTVQILPLDEPAEDFHRMDIFNADIEKMTDSLGTKAHENARSLLTATPDDNTEAPSNLRSPLAIYGWSDTLSNIFSRQTALTTRRIFLLVFFAAFAFNLFHSLPHGSHHETEGTHATTITEQTPIILSPTNAEEGHSSSAAVSSVPVNEPMSGGHGPKVSEPTGSSHESKTHDSENTGHNAGASSHESGTSSHEQSPSLLESAWSFLPWFLWIYLILVVINIMVHDRAEKAELQNKYQDYRALAEGLRVQIYWRLAGLHEDVTDHYLGKQRGELNWIRHAIKSCNVLTDATNKEGANAHSAFLPLVVQRWARDQRNYYVGKAHREHKELEKQEKIIRSFVMASVILSLALGLLLSLPSLIPLPFLEPLKHRVEEPLTHALIMITIVMSAVVAGLLHGYNAQLARAEHTKRYGRMGTLFEAACIELEAQLAKGNTHKTSAILHELGREALVENGDWVLLHRERPLEVPHAG
ncbi:hypothetical protein IAD21_06142 [Abditibacteriota bacterium]|nr:hypothetical protein IAD21_06142 [Abditibacteriota bacterium]